MKNKDCELIISENIYAKCAMSNCSNIAEWFMGTWQCCDECAKTYIKETQNGWGYSPWGTSSRGGQKAILEHNVKYNLKDFLIQK